MLLKKMYKKWLWNYQPIQDEDEDDDVIFLNKYVFHHIIFCEPKQTIFDKISKWFNFLSFNKQSK